MNSEQRAALLTEADGHEHMADSWEAAAADHDAKAGELRRLAAGHRARAGLLRSGIDEMGG